MTSYGPSGQCRHGMYNGCNECHVEQGGKVSEQRKPHPMADGDRLEIARLEQEVQRLREELNWQAACTKAGLESQDRLCGEVKSLKSRNAALVEGLRMMTDLCCRNNHPHLEGRGGGTTCLECQQARDLLKGEQG